MATRKHRLSLWCVCLLLQVAAINCLGQCPTSKQVYEKLIAIENSESLKPAKQLQAAIQLKKICDSCRLPKDSVYARLLHKTGVFAFNANNEIPTPVSLAYTLASIRINTSGIKGTNKAFAVKSYYNLASYYQALGQNETALQYFDSLLLYGKNFPSQLHFSFDAINAQLDIYFKRGEYQKSIETSTLGISKARATSDSTYLLKFYNYRAQAFAFQHAASPLPDIDSALRYGRLLHNHYEIASALKTKAFFYATNGDYTKAEPLYTGAIEERKKSNLEETALQLLRDYNDYGNFLLNAKKDYTKARTYYLKNAQTALRAGDAQLLATAYTCIGQASFRQHRLHEAEDYYAKAAAAFNIAVPADFLQNASAAKMVLVEDKESLIVWLNNKAELLLHLYKENKTGKYLDAAVQIARLTDTVITQLRREQIGEQSKLYWRNSTREFFTNALEIAYLKKDAALAFYFLERSRAVLLADKLNELGALAYIPDKEAADERNIQRKITEDQQRLLALIPASREYNELQAQVYTEREDQEKFIQSLEEKYSNYYQYKYADNVPALDSLQQYLASNHQSFIHYFMNDTVVYALGITSKKASFIRLTAQAFDAQQLSIFLQLCSDKEKLRSNYPQFAALAQDIYSKLFQPLQLPKGDVAICTDNFLIPFEALCTDAEGKNFLINNYSFSYVYSARTFMKPFAGNATATGNFIGFAPVAFAPALRLVSLNQSAEALSQSADFYNHHTLFTESKATRANFFDHAANYKVIAVFSHAQADTSGVEPVLYLQDSAIHLSELQLLPKPATQFVLLSACQTNTGKAATGEGIYSLARGFAAAGIPTVAGTLWKADDQTIYSISSKLNEYLAAGMNKSEALQKAKLWFISQHKDEHQLPYYWANMVLIGDTQPVSLIKTSASWWWAATIILSLLIAVIIVVLRKRNRTHAKESKAGNSQRKTLIHTNGL